MNTLFIIIAVALWIISSVGKKKKPEQKQKRFPPMKPPQAQKKQTEIKRPLDYMIKKHDTSPTTVDTAKQRTITVNEAAKEKTTASSSKTEIKQRKVITPVKIPQTHHEKESTYVPSAPSYDYSKSKVQRSAVLAAAENILQAAEFTKKKQTENKGPALDKKTMQRAVIYAEILKPPKSIEYLRRYGIRR